MKKICIITTVDITIDSFVIPSARELQKNGFEITFVTSMTENFKTKYSDEFNLIDAPFERGSNLFDLFRGIFFLLKLFRKEKFSLIQYSTPNASMYASIAGFINRTPIRLYNQWGIRYVGFKGKKRKLFKFIEKITCYLSTDIRSVSKKNLDFAVSENLYELQKSKVIGAGGAVGIDLNIFDVTKKEEYKKTILETYPSLNGKIVFGYVGRIDRDKGINELISAFKYVKSIDSNSVLLIIGPKDKDGALDENIIEFVNSCTDIIFTGFTNQIPQMLSVLDILVHPSYREGFSLVIQQAMAMCVSVITTDIPGPSEVIEENISGILVPAKDSTQLGKAMVSLSKNESLRIKFANNGFSRVKKLFIQEKMSKLILEDRLSLLNYKS